MKIKGIVTLVFKDKNTGKITKEFTVENTIMHYTLETYLLGDSTVKFGPYLVISENLSVNIAPDDSKRYLGRIHAVGITQGGITSPLAVNATSTTFSYVEWQQRFTPPAAAITINAIGLTFDSTIAASGKIDPINAYVQLASPCIQEPDETLDIFYRVQVPYDYWQSPSPVDRNTHGLSGSQSNNIRNRLYLGGTTSGYFNTNFPNWNGNVDFSTLATTQTLSGTQDSSTPLSGTLTKTKKADAHKYDLFTSIGSENGKGCLVGYLGFGGGTTGVVNPHASGVTDIGESVVQNIFGHRSTATLPFHDNLQTAFSTGTMIVNGDSWTNPDFPKMYRLDVTGSGALNVGTYQFKVRNHFGFVLNAYKDPERIMASLTYDNRHRYDDFPFTAPDATGTSWEDLERPVFMNYTTLEQAVAITKDQICIINLSKEIGVTFNVTNYPTFAPTNITQVTINNGNGDIYVGCRDTGIYKITDPLGSPTVTLIDNTATGLTGLTDSFCYGVSYGNGRLWAMWGGTLITDGGLFSSVDGGTTWVAASFTDATILANYPLVKYIKADKTHGDHRLAVVYESNFGLDTTMRFKIRWWDEVTNPGAGLEGQQFWALNRIDPFFNDTRFIAEEPWTYFLAMEPSPTGNKWGVNMSTAAFPVINQTGTLYPAYLPYGASASRLQNSQSVMHNHQGYCSWEYDSSGDEVICVVASSTTYHREFTLFKDDLTWTSIEFRNSNDLLSGHDTMASEGPVLYIGHMIHLCWFVASTSPAFYAVTSMNEVGSVNGHVDFQHLLWDSYGWNGSAWELDHAGTKPFHAAVEVLNDGVTISFDDDSGAQTFTSGDYYTVGVCQGVWLDGSTEIEHHTGVYYKKISPGTQTQLESGTLSATPRQPEIFEIFPVGTDEFTWQDLNNVITSTIDVLRSSIADATYGTGARSIEAITGTGIADKSDNDDIHGRFMFGSYTTFTTSSNLGEAIRCGLSPVGVLGTSINKDTIAYSIELAHLGSAVGNGAHAEINIIENGITVASAVTIIDSNLSTGYDFEIEILNDGTVNYYVWVNGTPTVDPVDGPQDADRITLHTSSGAAIVDYYIDVAMNVPGATKGIDTRDGTAAAGTLHALRYNNGQPSPRRRFTRRISSGLYLGFGIFANSTGRFMPNFFAVDSTQGMSILINGVEAVKIADNDTDTVLIAGEVSIFPREGFLRYSGADATNTITASYNVITTE